MSKESKVLDIVFHPAVFAVAFLAWLVLVIINFLYSVLPRPLGMLLLIPLAAFGLLGYLVDEWRYK